MVTTNRKNVSSMKFHRDLGITQKSTWFMLHFIRQASEIATPMLDGSVEMDETFVGAKSKQTDRANYPSRLETFSSGTPLLEGNLVY